MDLDKFTSDKVVVRHYKKLRVAGSDSCVPVRVACIRWKKRAKVSVAGFKKKGEFR